MENKKLWFRNKRYGWGWYPATWQGWAVLVVYITIIIGGAAALSWYTSANPDADASLVVVYIVGVFVLTVVLLYICYKTGEKPGWHWGGD